MRKYVKMLDVNGVGYLETDSTMMAFLSNDGKSDFIGFFQDWEKLDGGILQDSSQDEFQDAYSKILSKIKLSRS